MQYKAPLSADGLASLANRDVMSVGQLNKRARQLLETNFKTVWVEGEISNLSKPSSGHVYFTLKDTNASVRCAMFKNRNQTLRFMPETGMQVIARAKLSIYEARGDYQLIVENIVESGQGALQRAFEQLKTELAGRGWFSAEHKQAIPNAAAHIGIVTSTNAAALHDIITVLKRRSPSTQITIFPCLVQGSEAPAQIADAIECANHYASELEPPIEALIVGRGGGSLEDLWAFNSEAVAQAIFNSELPVVSAVGHEVDFAISDFVADVRAPTPSAAAELLSVDSKESKQALAQKVLRLQSAINNRLNYQQLHLDNVVKDLTHPGQKITEQYQRLDEIEIALQRQMKHQLNKYQSKLIYLQHSLDQARPQKNIINLAGKISDLHYRLKLASQQNIVKQQNKLKINAAQLNAVSPLATLARGYSITKTNEGEIVTSVRQTKQGEDIDVQLADGIINAKVTSTNQ
ncbi:MAG: exodeoxyribonuclease VII large subunit [Pseudomonadales bacterium]|jgi:exodeoxyribonuclease VII large subunit